MGKTVTICFTNNKGGSGKSTTCSNLGAAMARAGKKVLLRISELTFSRSARSQPGKMQREETAVSSPLHAPALPGRNLIFAFWDSSSSGKSGFS